MNTRMELSGIEEFNRALKQYGARVRPAALALNEEQARLRRFVSTLETQPGH